MRRAASLGYALVVIAVVSACGGDGGPEVELGEEAARGKAVADRLSCSSCHTGGVGPDLAGAWGTMVTLDDGSTVVFDAEYVTSSVRAPQAQSREGNWRSMPTYDDRQLDADNLAAIIAYLTAIGPAEAETSP